MEQIVGIMLSIKPKWAKLIYNGKKKIEWRKNIPQIYFPGMKIYIYETAPVCKVTGCFMLCDYFSKKAAFGIANPKRHLNSVFKLGRVSLKELIKYQGNSKFVYGWNVHDPQKFDEPKSLSEFGIQRAPQSWQYIKKETDK